MKNMCSTNAHTAVEAVKSHTQTHIRTGTHSRPYERIHHITKNRKHKLRFKTNRLIVLHLSILLLNDSMHEYGEMSLLVPFFQH